MTHDVLPVVPVDETSLIQLFQNLLGNAIHYRSVETPLIHISASRQKANWLFSCTDNGMGIDSTHHLRIFEAFKRLHASNLAGSGLGLAIRKRIVERYQGRIWVESEAGQGATFSSLFRQSRNSV